MKNHPPREFILFTTTALGAFIAGAAWLGMGHGVRHAANFSILAGLPVTLASGLLAASGFATLLWVLLSFRASSPRWRWAGATISALALAMPFLAPPAILQMITATERWDFEAAGPARLRQVVADLVRASAPKDYPFRWFGHEVPSEAVPLIIHRLVPPRRLRHHRSQQPCSRHRRHG